MKSRKVYRSKLQTFSSLLHQAFTATFLSICIFGTNNYILGKRNNMDIEDFELDELILRAYGYSEEETEKMLNDYFDVDEFLTDKLDKKDGVLNFVHDLINRLMPFCFIGESHLTKKTFQGFGYAKDDGTIAIAQREIIF